ncbi:hypothetical protein L3X38_036894 [Prunus dulcis]|uniref:Uncharacterized protein n=1 Tax=Prunus dulcis TaxID=3755 RepID=A0AAD4V424_PRUDU|nr:hypothetical protein L3X38_036894 [Prunus dulcis]
MSMLKSLHVLAKFVAYHEVAEISKFKVVVDAYKLGYLDYKSGVTSCHPIEDEDVELLCLGMPPAQDDQINVVAREDVKEQVADELAVDEDDTKDVAEQVAGATEHTIATNE